MNILNILNTGLAKIEFQLALRKRSSHILLVLGKLNLFFLTLVGRQLAWVLSQQASNNEKLLVLVHQENLIAPDDGTAHFTSLE